MKKYKNLQDLVKDLISSYSHFRGNHVIHAVKEGLPFVLDHDVESVTGISINVYTYNSQTETMNRASYYYDRGKFVLGGKSSHFCLCSIDDGNFNCSMWFFDQKVEYRFDWSVISLIRLP